MKCLWCLAAAGALLLLSCQRGESQKTIDFRHSPHGKGTPVATFGDDRITVEELEQRLSEMSPVARSRYQTLAQKKDYVEGMARFELLAAEALRQGLHQDPEVVETAKKVMVQKLLRKELDDRPAEISDAELAELYEKRKSDYVKPEMVRLSHIFIPGPKTDASARRDALAQAEVAIAKARMLQPMDYVAFGRLVQEYSQEPRTKALSGDMRFLTREELAREYGEKVAQAGFALKQVGELAGPVEAEAGVHVLKLQGRLAALNLGFEQVKTQLRNQLLAEKRSQAFQNLLARLRASSKYALHEDALSKVAVDLQAPMRPAKGPAPGYIPPAPTAAPPPPVEGAR